MHAGELLSRIADARAGLRPAERKVAEVVLGRPQAVLRASLADIAQEAQVSEPTVMRFCRGVGCDGFKDFKLRLAQSLVTGTPYVHSDVRPGDPVGTLTAKIFDLTIRTLSAVRNRLDPQALERAIEALARARRVEFYGLGASGAVAIDAHHKFFRLEVPCIAYVDPHMQIMSAATLGREDVVVAISHTGRTRELIQSARVAAAAGAAVVAITAGGSPLARLATIPLAVDTPEDTDVYTPMTSRLAHLVVIDVLATGVALRGGPGVRVRLKRMKDALREKRLPEEPARPPLGEGSHAEEG